MNFPKLYVDHKDRDGLNNQKFNLRLTTQIQNRANSCSRIGVSKYKGVVLNKPCKFWRARISFMRKSYALGYFINEIDAAKAYDTAAVKFHGEYANLNLG